MAAQRPPAKKGPYKTGETQTQQIHAAKSDEILAAKHLQWNEQEQDLASAQPERDDAMACTEAPHACFRDDVAQEPSNNKRWDADQDGQPKGQNRGPHPTILQRGGEPGERVNEEKKKGRELLLLLRSVVHVVQKRADQILHAEGRRHDKHHRGAKNPELPRGNEVFIR